MARVLGTAVVRIIAETRRAIREARRGGERAGRAFADGADSAEPFENVVRDATIPLVRDAQRAGRAAGRAAGDEFGDEMEQRVRATTGRIRPTVDVEINPLDAEFARQLRADIARIAKQVNAEIPLTTSGELFRRRVAAEIDEIERTMRVGIPADPELAAGFRTELKAKVDAVARTVRATVRVGVDVDRGGVVRRALRSMGRAVGDLTTAIGTRLTNTIGVANTALRTFGLSVGGLALTFLQITVAAPLVAGALTLVGGAAVAAAGAISGGVVGLPVLLTGLLAPIAAVAIGLDGIKAAAEPLKDEFDELRKSVSRAFEHGLRPVLKQLEPLFPILDVGLSEIAFRLSRMAGELANMLTSARGMDNLRAAFSGVSIAMSEALPGVKALFNAFLEIIGTTELWRILGETVGGVGERIGNMFQRLQASGTLVGSLEQVRDVLHSIVDVVVVLMEGSAAFFEAAGPGLRSFFADLGNTLSRLDWAGLGESFGGMIRRIGQAIDDIPPEVWREFGDAVGALSERFVKFVEEGGIASFIDGLAAIAEIVDTVIGAIKAIQDGLNALNDAVSGAGDAVYRNVTKPFYDAVLWLLDFLGIASPARKFIEIGEAIVAGMIGGLADGPREVGRKVAEIANAVVNALADLPGKIIDIGADLVDGFVRGITSKIGEAARAAARMAQDAYNAAKRVLGIASPSRVFASIGRDTIDGYLVGLRERIAAIQPVLRALFAQVAERARLARPERMIQAEDGSWVPESFYTGGVGAARPAALTASDIAAAVAAALGQAAWRLQGDDLVLAVQRAGDRLGRR